MDCVEVSMILLSGHAHCVHKGHHSCLPTLRPDGRALTLTNQGTILSDWLPVFACFCARNPAGLRRSSRRASGYDRAEASQLDDASIWPFGLSRQPKVFENGMFLRYLPLFCACSSKRVLLQSSTLGLYKKTVGVFAVLRQRGFLGK